MCGSAILYVHMPPKKSVPKTRPIFPQKVLNKTFYRFLFSFMAVVASALLFILVLGIGGGAV